VAKPKDEGASLTLRQQLEMDGLEQAIRSVDSMGVTSAERKAMVRRYSKANEILTQPLRPGDMSFIHSGLCQTTLPHTRLKDNHDVWKRTSGNFTLMVQPGVVSRTPLIKSGAPVTVGASKDDYVGVPYGAKARLILIFLQTEALKGRTVDLGKNITSFLRSIGLDRARGGPRGNLESVKDQILRISRCNFVMQWRNVGEEGDTTIIDSRIVEEMSFFDSPDAGNSGFRASLTLDGNFHNHLLEHAVPLDRRAIAHLSGNSVALDLYALLAYRLPKLNQELFLSWSQLQGQMGSNRALSRSIRGPFIEALKEVSAVYPDARVETVRGGVLLKPSPASVPKRMVNGYSLLEGGKAS